jgi:acid phosphatase
MRRLICSCAVAASLAGGATYAIAAGDAPQPVVYEAAGGAMTGVRPTAVGLPQLGQHGTIGAAELTNALITYHDSGAYDRDIAAVVGEAKAYLAKRLAAAAAPARRACRTAFRRTGRTDHGRRLYRRVRTCRTVAPRTVDRRPAIVLDIDETSLSNYTGLLASGFTSAGTVVPAATGTGAAIGPTVELFRYARAHDVAVFFVTGRPEAIRGATERNLRAAGYDGWDGLAFKPSGTTTLAFKAGERKAIEARGHEILVNVGDQESDLDGGHAARAFKLPNPFYFISD